MIRARAGRLAASLAIVVGVAVGLGTVAAQARPQQDPTSTTVPGATTEPSLLEGSPTSEAATTTTQPEQTAAAKANEDNRRVWYVVAGLVGVAILLAALTIYYAIRTRPSRSAPQPVAGPEPAPARPPVATAREPEPVTAAAFPPRRSRPPGRSVAGLDHSGSDDDWSPRGTGEHDRIEPASVPRSARPSRAARRTVLGTGAADDDRR